jgi:serine protease Do/serine protease DegQ
MKRTHLFSLTIFTLAGLGALTWPLSAQISAPVKGPAINYNFDTTPLDRSNQTILSSYSDMLDKVTPGVVRVYPSSNINPDTIQPSSDQGSGRRRGRRGAPPSAEDLPPNKPDWSDGNSTDYWVMGAGSGCIISADGYILTNHHVIADDTVSEGGASVTVKVDAVLIKLPDGREFPAKIIGSDAATDLALLKIDAKNLPTIKMADSDKARVGDIVFAVGNPMDVGLTVTHGIISAIGRSADDVGDGKIHIENFIQTDASINEGNSGGPLVDTEGRLIGLNSEIVSSSNDGGSIGIGFAVPSNLARHVADDLILQGRVGHGALGVQSQIVDHNLAQIMGITNTHGAIVTEVTDGSPAAKNGIQRYDVIVKVNDSEVDSPEKLSYLVAISDPGTPINLTVLRNGKPKVINLVLDDRDKLFANESDTTSTASAAEAVAVPPPVVRARTNGELLAGVSLLPLTNDLRDDQMPPDVNGMIVEQVAPTSPYFNLFRAGTVIMEVNKKPVSSIKDVKTQLKRGELNMFYIWSPRFESRYTDSLSNQPDSGNDGGHKELITEAVQ